jgi:Calcineurin-like phosphoesterase
MFKRTIAVVATAAAAMLAPVATAAQSPAAGAEHACTFASAPDSWNADIGDLRTLNTWRKGDRNSESKWVRRSVDTILGDIASRNPSAVLVAGDLVEGHWGVDSTGQGSFGPANTAKQRKAQIRRAGSFYYREWAQEFASHGLRALPAVGDHEIGDNPWRGRGGYGAGADFKRRAMGVYKHTWAERFTLTAQGHRYPMRPVGTDYQDTAYATTICGGRVLVVTIDVFRRTGGDVHARLSEGQLEWLDRTLADTTADTVVVQGHTPVLGPVRTSHSSALMYEGGRDSALWRTLTRHDDSDTNVFYFAGEVHTVTALRHGGVTQISHGGLIRFGELNYLVAHVSGDGVEFTVRRFHAESNWSRGSLWCTDKGKRAQAYVVYEPGSFVTGTMSIDSGGHTSTSGELNFGS